MITATIASPPCCLRQPSPPGLRPVTVANFGAQARALRCVGWIAYDPDTGAGLRVSSYRPSVRTIPRQYSLWVPRGRGYRLVASGSAPSQSVAIRAARKILEHTPVQRSRLRLALHLTYRG